MSAPPSMTGAGGRRAGAAADGWIRAEPRLTPALRAVLARARRRPLRPLALAAVVLAVLLGARAHRKPSYVATLTFRMAEGDLQDGASAPSPPARIREYVTAVALSRERILALMEDHGISGTLRRINPTAAVKSMRDDIDVTVVRNYFLLDRASAGEPRSALVHVSYSADDRSLASEVVHDIGSVILETQAAARDARIRSARDLHAAQAELVRRQVRALEQDRARLLAVAVDSARARAELGAVQRALSAASARVLELDRRAASLELARDAERSRLGLSFELVDQSVRVLRPPLGASGVAVYALLLFPALAIVAAIVLGAFDPHVYDAASVRLHGFPLLGAIPAFPGMDARAWRTRAGR